MKHLTVLLCVLALFACDDSVFYPRVIENVIFENNTDDTIFIRCDSTALSTPFFENFLFPKNSLSYRITGYSYDLWLSANQFEDHISHVAIYKLNAPGDTVYVNPLKYNKITQWQHAVYSDWDWDEIKFNNHTFVVDSLMFNL